MAVSDEIKARADMVDIVGRYVPLQKSGRSFKALCPFHTEKTPSFFVFPERQTWRCFGACAAGGDVFTFLMRIENLTFPEALRRLATETGVPLPSRRRREEEPLYQVNELAREHFSGRLASRAGTKAREYLQQRGLSSESIEAFELGLSPSDGRSLMERLSARGYSAEQLAMVGLVTQGQGGSYRDLFRGRLMFPIRDAQKRLVGFGGRALDDSTPKYLNTPQSPVFNKGRLLYGLDRAREGIQDGEVVVVEGYMDVIGTHQQGFSNVVASMGTSLTDAQVSLLRRVARTVVLALDPDVAGQEATLRSLESSWRVFQRQTVARVSDTTLYQRPETMELRVAVLPSGRDPDDIALENPEEWRRVVAQAMPVMEYLFTTLASHFDLSSAQGKSQVAQLLFPMIAALSNPFEQDRYFQRLARLLGVSEQTLAASVGRPHAARPRAARQRQEAASTPFERLEHDPLEELCLALVFQHPELAPKASGLRLEHFRMVESRELFTYWLEDVNMKRLGESLDSELKAHLERLLLRELPSIAATEREAVVVDCVRRLEERRLRELKVEEELRLAEASKEEFFEEGEQVLELTERIKRLFHTRVD